MMVLLKSNYKKIEKEPIQKFRTYILYQIYGITTYGERVALYRECENRR